MPRLAGQEPDRLPAGPLFEVRDPATEDVIERVPAATEEDADAAVERAAAAFEGWRAVAPADRARLLRRLAERLDAERERLARLEMRNTGKPIADARGELGMVVDTFAYYAGAPERLLGDTIPVAGGVDLTFREPLGVVGLIVPWNFPLTIASWKLAPALAAGNTVVLKPAGLTPLTALRFAELAAEAGIPPGVVNVLPGPGRLVGRRLVGIPRSPRSPSPARPRSAARSCAAPPGPSSGSPWSWAASPPTWCSPTPTLRPRPPPRRRRCSATPARTAAPAPASWSNARPWRSSWRCWSRPSPASGSATRPTKPPRWAR
jgi:hypothetical protein